MESVRTKRFKQAEETLPEEIKKELRKAFNLWKNDPRHPSLRMKNVVPGKPIYSVRITLLYRAIGVLDGDTMVWIWVGNHEDYERFLAQL